MNLYKQIKLEECNLNLSSRIIGFPLNVGNKSPFTVDDQLLNYILEVNKIEYKPAHLEYQKILDILKVQDIESVDLINLVGKQKIAKKMKAFQDLASKELTDYYFNVLQERYSFTSQIEDAAYDHISSITGRMVIKKGTNYLTMKKDNRHKILKNSNSKLVEIDVKSCEPALLHAVIYNETPDDIYKVFSESGIPRAKVKIAVISSLYGSTPRRVEKISGLSRHTIEKIHHHFQLKERIKSLQKEHTDKGYFFNMYGRPIYEISSPVNYWLQSTAADFCCLAFKDLIERKNLKLKAVIHDAIIVEVDSNQYDTVKEIKEITDPISGISLRVDNTLIA